MKIEFEEGTILYDKQDHHLVRIRSWNLQKSRYGFYAVASTKAKGKPITIYMHRMILGAVKGEYVDHRNHNGLDNRRKNLRICTNGQNGGNSRKVKPGKSKYKGVHPKRDRWEAYISPNGKKELLGVFESQELAAAAYDIAAVKQWGEFAHLNKMSEKLKKKAQTVMDCAKKRTGSSSYRGVCYNSSRQVWRATFYKKHIGNFQTEIEAAEAYNVAAKEKLGKKAILNHLADS